MENILGTAKFRLKGLTETQKSSLTSLSFASRKLYNQAIQIIHENYRQHYSVLHKEKLISALQSSDAYMGKAYDGIIDLARKNFIAEVVRKRKKPTSKNSPFVLILPPRCIIDNSYILVPKTKTIDLVSFKLPKYCKNKSITSIMVRPISKDIEQWEVLISYKIPVIPTKKSEVFAGLDYGIVNFCTISTSNGDSIIVDGRRLKSILWHDYQLQKSENYGTKLKNRRINQVNDYCSKSVSIVYDFCKEQGIQVLVIGSGMRNNDLRRNGVINFWQHFPFAKFEKALISKLASIDVKIVFVDECYTSVSSFIDNDFLPPRITRAKQNFSGKRKKRGLYKSKDGYIINADVNASLNILRKTNLCKLTHLQNEPKKIKSPKRINPLDK